MLPAGRLNRKITVRKRAPMTNTPGTLRGGFVDFGTEWGAYDEGRPAPVTMFDLALTGKSATLSVRDSAFSRAINTDSRVVIDGEEFEVTAILPQDRANGIVKMALLSTPSLAMVARELEQRGEEVTVRRPSSTGPAVEVTARARVTGYTPEETVGGVTQADRKVTLSAEDLQRKGFPLPLKRGVDKLVVRGRLMTIDEVDDSTFTVAGQILAYRIRATG